MGVLTVIQKYLLATMTLAVAQDILLYVFSFGLILFHHYNFYDACFCEGCEGGQKGHKEGQNEFASSWCRRR